jgi:hypothetical protein
VLDGKLSSYLAAGGRLFVLGGRLGSALNGVRPDGSGIYPKGHPDSDNAGYEKDSFLWRYLRFRNWLVSTPSSASPQERESSGLVMARSLHPAYPDLRLNRQKWDPWAIINQGTRFRGGIDEWEGVKGDFLPIEQMPGLDSLYASVNMDTTFCCGPLESGLGGAIVGQRYESTRLDTLRGTQQGRTLVLDFQPWWFESAALTDAGTAAINWLVTGKDH